jgi:hypothetical protein
VQPELRLAHEVRVGHCRGFLAGNHEAAEPIDQVKGQHQGEFAPGGHDRWPRPRCDRSLVGPGVPARSGPTVRVKHIARRRALWMAADGMLESAVIRVFPRRARDGPHRRHLQHTVPSFTSWDQETMTTCLVFRPWRRSLRERHANLADEESRAGFVHHSTSVSLALSAHVLHPQRLDYRKRSTGPDTRPRRAPQ